MADLYLIAHRVRGEPAFDVAQRIECAECLDLAGTNYGCNECDQLGYWWIIGTSGHRAYPAQTWALKYLYDDPEFQISVLDAPMPLMDGLPDHYLPTAEPKAPSLLDRLNLRPIQPPIIRRI